MSETRIYRLKLMGWRLYLSNCRMKKMSPSMARRTQRYGEAINCFKHRHYKQNGGTCDLCGKPIDYDEVQLHHVLPFGEFPQYGTNPANMEIACAECHHALHMNPYENLHRMEQKAREFGFDLREYYLKEKKQ